MYSLDSLGCVGPALSELKPLVRIRSVFPSGLIAVVTAWPTTNDGSPGRSGFSGWKVEPVAAVGVIRTPVGINSPVCTVGPSARLFARELARADFRNGIAPSKINEKNTQLAQRKSFFFIWSLPRYLR